MPDALPDPNLLAAVQVDRTYRDCANAIASDRIREVAKVFIGNVDRVISLVEFVPLTIGIATLQTKEAAEYTHRLNDPGYAVILNANAHQSWVPGTYQPYAKQHFMPGEQLKENPLPDATRSEAIDRGSRHLSHWVSLHPEILAGAEQLLASAVTGAWTAFEVLASDLWEQAVNDTPKLGFAALGALPKPDDSEDEKERKRRTVFSVPLEMFDRPDIDVLHSLGTIIKRHEKWNFSKREHVKDAYRKTFPELWEKLKPIFESQQIFWLSKLRNAIVHDGSIVRPDFKACFRSHSILSSLTEGQAIRMTGEIVAPLISAAIANGTMLIEAISQSS